MENTNKINKTFPLWFKIYTGYVIFYTLHKLILIIYGYITDGNFQHSDFKDLFNVITFGVVWFAVYSNLKKQK